MWAERGQCPGRVVAAVLAVIQSLAEGVTVLEGTCRPPPHTGSCQQVQRAQGAGTHQVLAY